MNNTNTEIHITCVACHDVIVHEYFQNVFITNCNTTIIQCVCVDL